MGARPHKVPMMTESFNLIRIIWVLFHKTAQNNRITVITITSFLSLACLV